MYRNWRDLIKPREVEIDERSKTATYAEFVCEPLERGFGITIGNALRRILLSSIVGAAVTKVKIDGVLHEFTSVPEVREDVTDIVLNIKELRLKLHGEDSQTVSIDVKGPANVTAADIQCGNNVEVLNKELPIATVGEDGHLKMELTVEAGRGYVPAEENKSEDDAIGVIAIDSLFSPIRKVNYQVTNARVGQRTDYDKLKVEVYTDGSVAPEDAMAYAAKIMKEQMTIFINFDETVEPPREESKEEPDFNENLLKTIDDLELSVRSQNCLQTAGVRYLGDLVQKSEAELLKVKNFGRKSLKEIEDKLSTLELELGTKLENWPPKELEKLKAEG